LPSGRIKLSPLKAQTPPPFLASLKAEISRHWSTINLLDILKEADFRVGFTQEFNTLGNRQILEPATLHKRLLLCLFGLGTNIGLKQASRGDDEQTADDLLYIKRYFLSRENLRNANIRLVNATLAARLPHIWGTGNVACASDSRKFAVRGENLKTEWHNRYHGRGVMIYWHVERKALAIYSQLKAPSSSEVATMLEGILHHATTLEVEQNYVDSHGQSELAFAFCYLLGFDLRPRLKNLRQQKLYFSQIGDEQKYPALQPILSHRPIDWSLIQNAYDDLIQYATALYLGTASVETILKRFTQTDLQHPTHRALLELGKVVKTIFLCKYLNSEPLRYEVEEGLNVIENWNSATTFIGYGRTGELAGRRLVDQELTMLSLQLLQNSLIYVNTLLLQQVLAKSYFFERMTTADWRGLTPLFYTHINPYGSFKLDLNQRIPIEEVA
jgi:TnpA family transposase